MMPYKIASGHIVISRYVIDTNFFFSIAWQHLPRAYLIYCNPAYLHVIQALAEEQHKIEVSRLQDLVDHWRRQLSEHDRSFHEEIRRLQGLHENEMSMQVFI